MTIGKAIEHFREYQRTTVKKRTQDGYKKLLDRFQSKFSDHQFNSIKTPLSLRNYAGSSKPIRKG
jgi:hypothetical protein